MQREITLPREAVEALRRAGAYREARRLIKEGRGPPTPLALVRARLRDAVFALSAEATPLAEELGGIAAALAFYHAAGLIKAPALVLEWVRTRRPEDWERAVEAARAYKRGDLEKARQLIALNLDEAVDRFRSAVGRFIEEALSIAGFSPGAYQKVRELAWELSRGGPLEKYLSMRLRQALRGVEPARAPDVEVFNKLPEAVREGLRRLVKDLEEGMAREGFYRRVVEAFYSQLGVEGGEDPRVFAKAVAERLREIWRVDLREGESVRPGYRREAEEAFSKAVRELEELSETPLSEVGAAAGRVFDALAEALSYVVEDRFLRWVGEGGGVYDGDRLAEIALEAAEEVGVGGEELAAEAVYKALGRWAEASRDVYMKYLERGQAPVPEGLAVVFMSKSLRALRRLVAAPALVAGEEGAAVRFFVYHPALGEVVERLLGMAAASGLRHLGIAPREFLHTLGVPGEVEGAVEAFRSVVDRVFEIARHAPRLGEFRPSVGRELRLLLNYGLYKWVEAQERYKPVVELLKGDEGVEARGEWWRVIEAAVGYEVGKRLVELWRREAGRDRSVLWEWFVDPPIAPGVLLAVAENIAERNAAEAQYKLEVLKAFLKWLASPSQLAPETDPSQWRTDNPLFQTAVRIYAEATGRRFDAAWGEAARRLREIQPPSLREEERGKTTEAHTAKSAERPAQASKDAGRAEAAGGRGGAAAVVVGVIPPRLRDVEAADWLAGRMGRGELGEVFKRRADRAVERVKARYGERLRRGGEALLELAEQAARWAYDAALAVASSRGAVAYVLELLDAAEGPVFGLKPRTPLEADAAKIFAKVGEYVRRAEAEFGEGLLVWSFARAVAEAVLKEAQRLWDEAYRGVASVERALAAAAATTAGAAALAATHDALLSTAVVSATAAAIALAKEGAYDKAVEHVKRAAEAAYEALRDVLEKARVALERLYELFVEAVARVVGWIDEHRAWLFLAAAASAGIITWAFAHDVLGSVQLGKLALVAGLIKYGEFKKPPTAQELVEAVRKRNETVGRALEELFSVVDQLYRGVAEVDEERLLGIVNQLEAAEGVGEPWLESVVRTLEHWESGKRSKEERSRYAKAAFLIVWAVLQRRAPEVYNKLMEMLKAREEAAEVLKEALGGDDREKWRKYYDVLKKLREAEREVLKIAGEVESELNRIAVNLKAAAKGAKGLEEVARWVEVNVREAGELAEATAYRLSRFSGASYGTRAVAYLKAVVGDNAVGLTALRAFAAGDLASLVANTPVRAYIKLLGRAQSVRRGQLSELPLEERLAVALGRVLKDAEEREELKHLAEAFERGVARVEKTEKEGEYVIYAGGMKAKLELKESGGAELHVGELTRPLAERKLEEARRAVEKYEGMRREGIAPPPLREAQDGWLLSDVHVREDKNVITMKTTSLEQVVTFLSAFGVGAGEIHWGEGERERKPVKIYIERFSVTSEGLKAMYYVELGGEYFKKVWERLSAARSMSEDEKRAFIDFVVRHLEGSRRERLRERLERWLGEWLAKAPGLKQHRVFHTLVNSLRELMQGEQDAGKRGEARRRAVGRFLYAVLGDGSVYQDEVVLVVGGGRGDKVPAEVKADLYYALLRALGYQPKITKAERAVHIRLYGDEARRFAREALPYLVGLERVLESVKSDEQIYSKVAKLINMARAERVKAWIEGFTAEGKIPKARLVVEADGAAAEYPISLGEHNTVRLHFDTTDREEAERRAAVLRAVGVKAEVKKKYDKSRNRDKWYIDVSTNALAADSVHEAVRRAVAEFLRLCKDVGAIGEDTYRRLAAKFERGVPEWGDVRFSVVLKKDGAIEVLYQPQNPQSFSKAVEFLRGMGMRDICEGEWCIVHFTARGPEGSKTGYLRITVDGLRYIGWLASRGDERAQWLKEMLLREAERRGEGVRKRLEEYFREGEMWGSVELPIEKEVEVEGRRVKVRVEEVEAGIKQGKTREHLVVKVKAKVFDGTSEVAVEKEARFFKSGEGYVNIHAGAEGGREADYVRTAAVLKTLGIEGWSVSKEGGKLKKIRLTGGALEALTRLEPVCAALGICQKPK
jgi:hypothetical protein